MPTTLDCEVLRDLYGSEEVRRAFDSRALVQAWLDVERALAEAEAEIGVIPVAAAERIAREADASLYDLAALRRGIAESQHPLVPLVRALAARPLPPSAVKSTVAPGTGLPSRVTIPSTGTVPLPQPPSSSGSKTTRRQRRPPQHSRFPTAFPL